MLCGYHFNTTLGQRNLSDSWTGFMIFMKPTYALCGFYENCKAHFGSSHSITMVFLHTLKPLGQGALPDLDCARLHLVQVLIPVKPLPYGFTYHFLHFNCNIYHFFHTSWCILLKCIDNIKLTSFKRHGSHESTLFDIWHILIVLKRFQVLSAHTSTVSDGIHFHLQVSSLVALYLDHPFQPFILNNGLSFLSTWYSICQRHRTQISFW